MHFFSGSVAFSRLFFHALCLFQLLVYVFSFFVLRACGRFLFVTSFWMLHAFPYWFGRPQPFVFPCFMSLSVFLPFFGSSFWLPVFVYVSSVPFFGRFLHFFIGSPSAVCFYMFYVSVRFFFPCFGSSFWVPVFVFVLSVCFIGRFMHFFLGSVSVSHLFFHALCLCQRFSLFGSSFWLPVFVFALSLFFFSLAHGRLFYQ
jgi:hypothetical protein